MAKITYCISVLLFLILESTYFFQPIDSQAGPHKPPAVRPPLPGVTINDSDEDLTLTTGDALFFDISLLPGDAIGDHEYWLVITTPFGTYSFDAATLSWLEGLAVTYQGPLMTILPTSIDFMDNLPVGSYTVYFGVDSLTNGSVDPETLIYDSLMVTVSDSMDTGTEDEDLMTEFQIPSDGADDTGVFVRMVYPSDASKARYGSAGAPVMVNLQGGMDATQMDDTETLPDTSIQKGFGVVYLNMNYPGGYKTGGIDDQRGPNGQKAVRDVIRFALGKISNADGQSITDLVPFADTDNVGVVSWSNGGNIAVVTMDLYGSDLAGVRYYCGWENPAGDEYVQADLGSSSQPNPAYRPGRTILDAEKGSISIFDTTHLTMDEDLIFFDLDGDRQLGANDYLCSGWVYDGLKYFSTEVTQAISMVAPDALSAADNEVANVEESDAFWRNRDMSRHFQGVVTHLGSTFQGAIVFSSSRDHVQGTPDYPHMVVHYNGWVNAGLPFVRINGDECYSTHVVDQLGIDLDYTVLSDNDANTTVTLENAATFPQAETGDLLYEISLVTGAALELADRVHTDEWRANLSEVLVENP